jgi:hypothetical protein
MGEDVQGVGVLRLDEFWTGRRSMPARCMRSVSMNTPSSAPAWLRPRKTCLLFTEQSHYIYSFRLHAAGGRRGYRSSSACGQGQRESLTGARPGAARPRTKSFLRGCPPIPGTRLR